jgi:hypothetical protein
VDPGSAGPLDRALAGTAALLVLLAAFAIGALVWASEDHGTRCSVDQSGPTRDAGPILHPIVVGCTLAAFVLAFVLLALSRRRRGLTGAPSRRPGIPSAVVGLMTSWCAAVYLPATLMSGNPFPAGGLLRIVALPPVALLFAVALPVVVLQYALFLPPLILIAIALTRRTAKRRYAIMQVAVFYALLSCIAVVIGSALLMTGFCMD